MLADAKTVIEWYVKLASFFRVEAREDDGDVWALVFSKTEKRLFEAACVRWLETGRKAPLPADLREVIAQMRPPEQRRVTGDEAWAIALEAENEAISVVWTPEIAKAWAAARPVLAVRDRIGARRTFLDAYARFVSQAEMEGDVVQWEVSQGHDPQQRADGIEKARNLNRLSLAQATHAISHVKPLMLTDQSAAKDANADAAGLALIRKATEEMMAARAQRQAEEAAQREAQMQARAAKAKETGAARAELEAMTRGVA